MSESKDNSNEDGDHRQPDPKDENLEARVAKLLESANPQSSPVEANFLEELKRQTTQAFLDSNTQDSPAAPEVEHTESDNADGDGEFADTELNTRSKSLRHSTRSRRMLSFIYRAIAVSIVGVIGWLGMSGSIDKASPTLGEAFAKVAAANSFKMQLSQASLTLDVLATPQQVRLSGSGSNYVIGKPTGTWNVNTATNQVVAKPAKYFGANGQINLLSFLGDISDDDLAAVSSTGPVKRTTFEDVECWHYQTTLRCDGLSCGLVAYVHVETGQLRQLELTPPATNQGRSVAKLNIVQWNQPIEESLFAISEELTPAGEIGQITSVQGLVSYRPLLQRRWSLAKQQMRLQTGDQIRTGTSGANAVQFRTKQNSVITLGPDSIVELVSNDNLRVLDGELRVVSNAEKPITLSGPNDQTIAETDTAFYRVINKDGKQTLSKMDHQPAWLAGFDGTSNHDPTGSLVANIDGRNTPLTVGYHKVSVDIRDQIARTVVEQSFVNHTAGQLEGVFYFPLPQDSSISGFGMWINGELVEADIVEKQRAREIYETILREKRDPGLLEWTGGNIFKARVFPILGNSEKRIKITYTQVLPKKDNRYVYQYALQSEMLRQNPLRDLSVNVRVHSEAELKKVDCPTHQTRDSQTEHSAQIDFVAQNYSPTSDLEVTVDVANSTPPIAAIPHLRGDEGYLLLQVSPPRLDQSGWQDLSLNKTTEESPLEFLIVADTSASMNEIARQQQLDFIQSFVSLLSPEDSVRLVAADVELDWQSESLQAGGAETSAKLVAWLKERHSLGWSDLLKAFAQVQQEATPGSQIIYVGDGMTATFDTDMPDFLAQLKQTLSGKTNPLHAVGVGSSFESVVLDGMGTLSGGSSRMVSTSQSPQNVAAELLTDVSQPTLRDLKVEFDGLQIAAVYPTKLPNLAEGKQQMILARYLPVADDTNPAMVTISGTRNGQPVSWKTPLKFDQAEAGNSFIPRLWARKHLDYLLAQGSAPSIQDQVIELSERFHIITPYTSLLVLESDADRARFGVKRRYGMRDGERFFADGRSATDFDLLQNQMQTAGNWRIGLQHQFLQHFATLGEFTPRNSNRRSSKVIPYYFTSALGTGEESDAFGVGGYINSTSSISSTYGIQDRKQGEREEWSPEIRIFSTDGDSVSSPLSLEVRRENVRRASQLHQLESSLVKENMFSFSHFNSNSNWSFFEAQPKSKTEYLSTSSFKGRSSLSSAQQSLYHGAFSPFQGDIFANLVSAFPLLTSPAAPTDKWPEEVRNFLSDWNSNNPSPDKLDGGIEVVSSTTNYAPQEHVSSKTKLTRLAANKKWLVETHQSGSPTRIDWCNGQQRLRVEEAFAMGRRRIANATERRHNPLASDFDLINLLRSLQWAKLSLSEVKDAKRTLDLRYFNGSTREIVLDVERWVVLSDTQKNAAGKLTSQVEYSDFIEAGDRWWAQQVRTLTEYGSVNSKTQHQIRLLDSKQFDKAFQAITNRTETVVFLDESSLHSIRAAFNAVAQNKATITDHLVRLDWYLKKQNWKRAAVEITTIKKLAPNNPVVTGLLELQLFHVSRKDEQLRLLTLKLADKAIAAISPDSDNALALANHLSNQSHILQTHERLKLHRKLKPASEKSVLPETAFYTWNQTDAVLSHGIEAHPVNLERRHKLALQRPYMSHVQSSYAQHLHSLGLHEAADQWFERVLQQGPNPDKKQYANPQANQWDRHEYHNLLQAYLQQLKSNQRYQKIVEVCERFFNQQEIGAPLDANHQTYLDALGYIAPEKETETVLAWLAEISAIKELPETNGAQNQESVADMFLKSRVRAAIDYASQRRYRYHRSTLDFQYLKPLAQLVREASQQANTVKFASEVVNSSYLFKRSNEYRVLQKEFLDRLEKDSAELSPKLLDFLMRNAAQPKQGDKFWQPIADKLQTRWLAQVELLKQAINKFDAEESFENQKAKNRQLLATNALARSLTAICSRISEDQRKKATNQISTSAQIAFYRLQIKHAWDENQLLHANQRLFNALLGMEWNQATEDEAYQLITQLVPPQHRNKPSAQSHWLSNFERWATAFKGRRVTQAINQYEQLPESKPNSETNTPTERAEARKAAVDQVVGGLIESLKNKENNDLTPKDLKAHVRMHRHRLELRRDENLDEIRVSCRQILGDKPTMLLATDPQDPQSTNHIALDQQLKNQALLTLLYIGARKTETADNRQWIEQYIKRGVASTKDSITLYQFEQPDDEISPAPEPTDEQDIATQQADIEKRTAQQLDAMIADWRTQTYQWMIATDQIDPLMSLLAEWIETDDGVGTWRHALAMLAAERGEVAVAIKHFEQIEANSHLSAGDYHQLSQWYVVVDRKEDSKRAIRAKFDSQPINELQKFVQQHIQLLKNTQNIPADLDENVLPAIRSMLSRSGSNSGYPYSTLFGLYNESKDFRLLEAIPDSLLGRSNNNAYAALHSIDQDMRNSIRDEATADTILGRIAQLREQSDSNVDLHVLALLEVLVELRNGTIEDQASSHITQAKMVLQGAAKNKWATGERALMANYLHHLVIMKDKSLMGERVGQLESLLAAEVADPISEQSPLDRLTIAHRLGQTLRKYGRHADAIARLTPELDHYLSTKNSSFSSVQDTISTLIDAHVALGHFMAAETQLQDLVVKADDDNWAKKRNQWIREQLNELYLDCFSQKGSVSLGSGEALYSALQDRLLKQFLEQSPTPIENRRYILLTKLTRLYQYAAGTISQAKADQRKFALETAAPIVQQMFNHYSSSVQHLTSSLEATDQNAAAVECFLNFFETQPTWCRRDGKLDIDYLENIVRKTKDAKKRDMQLPKALEERLVKMLIVDLKYRLTHLIDRSPYFARNRRSLAKHKMRFRNAALDVWEQNSKSNNHARIISDFLFSDLAMRDDGVVVLDKAYKSGVLNQNNASHLVDRLVKLDRYRRAIEVLLERMEADPSVLYDHTRLMIAYHNVGQQEKAKAALQAADARFKFDDLEENTLSLVATACRRSAFHAPAVKYLQWLTQRRRKKTSGRKDRTLEDYYIQLSSAHRELGELAPALEAANAALVVSGADHGNNLNSINHLRRLVRSVADGKFDTDLDRWVKQLDQQAAETGQYNYILRNLIAQHYQQMANYKSAIKQFELAIELMPNDPAIHESLIKCYQQSRDQQAEIQQRIELIKLDRRNVANYQKLGERLHELSIVDAESDQGKQFAVQAERAFTSMVEMLPTETEGHIALAKVRTSQKRWNDSIKHWQRVVTIRSKEPTGLVGLCGAQIDAGQIDQAKASIGKLKKRDWPTRFDTLNQEISALEQRLR